MLIFNLIIIAIFIFLFIKLFLVNNVETLDLQNSITGEKINKYFKFLYGRYVPSLSKKDFIKLDILYTKYLKQSGIEIKYLNNFTCPHKNNTPIVNMASFLNMTGFEVPDTIWVYHKPPYKPFKSNSFVEVTHCTSIVSDIIEQNGAWFYAANGSNVFINIGKTIVFENHVDAVKKLLGSYCNDFFQECILYFPSMVKKVIELGYDSIQFLSHSDMRCGNTAVEILMVNSKGAETIPKNIEYRTGYKASEKCIPIEVKNCLQCKKSA